MYLLAVLSVCLTVVSIQACSLPRASCPDVEVTSDFNLQTYLGRWYEIARVPTPYQRFGECVTATYSLSGNTTYPVKVLNRQFNESSQEYETMEGGARLASPDMSPAEGKLFVYFPLGAARDSNYWVVDTDYENFSLVFSCNVFGGVPTRSIWILSRQTTLSAASKLRVDVAMAKNMLDPTTLVDTRQGGECKYED